MSTGTMIAAAGRLTFATGQTLLKGIPDDRFGRLPMGEVGVVPTNHPAWAYGHLGLYGRHVLQFLGDEEGAAKITAPDGWNDLFDMGSACQDDPDSTIYPARSKIIEQFENAYEAALLAIEQADTAVFEKINPNENMRSRFPTVGVAVTFMLTAHMALHLGQVSAWRRIEGHGSAMDS